MTVYTNQCVEVSDGGERFDGDNFVRGRENDIRCTADCDRRHKLRYKLRLHYLSPQNYVTIKKINK